MNQPAFLLRRLPPVCLALAALLLLPEAAYAQGADPISVVLCEIVTWFTGYVGKGVASLAIIVLGIMALFGKLNPAMAVSTVIGITIMFSATPIVNELHVLDAGMTVDCDNTNVEGINSYNRIAIVLCSVARWFTSDVGAAIAIAGVLLLGGGALFGKLSAGQAFTVVLGLTLIFGFSRIIVDMNLLGSAEVGADMTCSDISGDSPPVSTTIGAILCQIVGWFYSDIARGMAVAGVVSMGAMAMLGRLTWGFAFFVTIGVILVFGGLEIVRDDLMQSAGDDIEWTSCGALLSPP